MDTTSLRSTGDLAVEASGLVKVFGRSRAVDGVDLAIPRGSSTACSAPTGPERSRRSGSLRRCCDRTPARHGCSATTSSATRPRCAARVSLTAQFASVDEDLTAFENLVLLARLLGHSRRQAKQRAHELLVAFDLAGAGARQVARLSGGMRRKLDIAASIIVTPDLLFLDEPTTGLDPRSRNQVWEIVRTIVADGTTVLLTTQYLDEADRLADRIAVIDRGRVIAEGTRGALKASVGAGGVRVRLLDPAQRDQAASVLGAGLGVPVHAEPDPAGLAARIPAEDGARQAGQRVAHALAELARSGIAISDFALGQPSLDEVFLALTGSRAEFETRGEEAMA